ncbi:MAG: hypothetical protein IT578_07740 [Verrucomicrobiae bacterium]|nr:hypothetical protein [Verrucomicrobiae bacterium]
MKPDAPLSRLLASWTLCPPSADGRFVADTMRAVRRARPKSWGRRWAAWLDALVQDWLPSPGAALSALGALALALGAIHFTAVAERAREGTALAWRDSVLRPSSSLWIAAVHRDLAESRVRP